MQMMLLFLVSALFSRSFANIHSTHSNSECAHWCSTVFGADTAGADNCTSNAAHQQGLCYTCGPAAASRGSLTLCGTTCVNTTSDLNNCGQCGNVCQQPNNDFCCSGTCAKSNNNHCGSCGNVCSTDTACCDSTSCSPTLSNCQCTSQTAFVCSGKCVEPQTDSNNCGSCGNVCQGGQICSSGQCICPAGQTNCSGVCKDTTSDLNNCGSCGNVCQGLGGFCNLGQCGCSFSEFPNLCNGVCVVDIQINNNNCGSCGNVCQIVCCGGVCVDIFIDNNNCGLCGTVCSPGQSCSDRQCV